MYFRSRRPPRLWSARDQFLARPGLAGDERRADVRRQPADRIEQLLHRRAAADHPLEFEAARELAVDGQEQPPALDAALDRREQLAQPLEVERLAQIVERAELDRFDRGIDRAVRRHENYLA